MSSADGPSDALAASRTLLELTATLMESGFEVLGEGVVVGTMPAYLERFGRDNARYVDRNHLPCQPQGAASALGPMNFVSQATDTDFEMVEQRRDTAVKRLHTCEFLAAFEDRGDFPKTMICLLHKAAYQGSVNGLVDAAHGFDVDVKSRILFGDDHCDFQVTARQNLPADEEAAPAPGHLDPDEQARLAYGFYTFILTSFVDYLTTHLPQARVETMLRDCARRVGGKVCDLMANAGLLPDAPEEAARRILELGGRTFDGGTRVATCPQAEHIIATSKGHDDDTARRVRENACRLCKNLVEGAVGRVAPGTTVDRPTALTLGDDHCDFKVGG